MRATIARDMYETFLKKVTIDIAVPQNTGGPPATGAEECHCPAGYKELSCEECATVFYRRPGQSSDASLGECMECPCNGNEKSCSTENIAQQILRLSKK